MAGAGDRWTLAQLLDNEAIKLFKAEMKSKEERGLTYWTRQEFKALKDSQAIHLP